MACDTSCGVGEKKACLAAETSEKERFATHADSPLRTDSGPTPDRLRRPTPSTPSSVTGCRLTCILDACHSAGALDLPFIFTGAAGFVFSFSFAVWLHLLYLKS